MTIAQLNRATAVAARLAEVMKERGKSPEKVAAATDLSLRTVYRLVALAEGDDPNYAPDSTTLDRIEGWIASAPPAEIRAENIDHICTIVRNSGLPIQSAEAVIAAFKAVWSVAMANRPWFGNDDDARLLLSCCDVRGPVGEKYAAIYCGWQPGSDRFLRARAVLVALGYINPTDKVLSITPEGERAIVADAPHISFDQPTVMRRWLVRLPPIEQHLLALAARPGGVTIEEAREGGDETAINLGLGRLIDLGVVGGYGSRFQSVPPLREAE